MAREAYDVARLKEEVLIPRAKSCASTNVVLGRRELALIQDAALDDWVASGALRALELPSLLNENVNKVVAALHLPDLTKQSKFIILRGSGLSLRSLGGGLAGFSSLLRAARGFLAWGLATRCGVLLRQTHLGHHSHHF